MSHSYKHVINYSCATSNHNKLARSKANRALRRAVKMAITRYGEDTEILPLLREVSCIWSFPSDVFVMTYFSTPKWIFEAPEMGSPIQIFHRLIGK